MRSGTNTYDPFVASITSKGTSIGITLAFNTIGWDGQNALFDAVDAFGTGLGTFDEIAGVGKSSTTMVRTQNSFVSRAGLKTVPLQVVSIGGTGFAVMGDIDFEFFLLQVFLEHLDELHVIVDQKHFRHCCIPFSNCPAFRPQGVGSP